MLRLPLDDRLNPVMARLINQQSESELRCLVFDAQLRQVSPEAFDRLHRASDLGNLMGRVIDVLIGDFDGRHEASVAEVAGVKEINSLVKESR